MKLEDIIHPRHRKTVKTVGIVTAGVSIIAVIGLGLAAFVTTRGSSAGLAPATFQSVRPFLFYVPNPLANNAQGKADSVFPSSKSCADFGGLSYDATAVVTYGEEKNPPVSARRRLAGDADTNYSFTQNNIDPVFSRFVARQTHFIGLGENGTSFTAMQLCIPSLNPDDCVNLNQYLPFSTDLLFNMGDEALRTDVVDISNHGVVGLMQPILSPTQTQADCPADTECFESLDKFVFTQIQAGAVKPAIDNWDWYAQKVPSLAADGVGPNVKEVLVPVAAHLVYAMQVPGTDGKMWNTCYDTHDCVRAGDPSHKVLWNRGTNSPAEAGAVCLSAANSPGVMPLADGSKLECLSHYDDESYRGCFYNGTFNVKDDGRQVTAESLLLGTPRGGR